MERPTISTGELHVSGTGRKTKKAEQQELLDTANELLLQVNAQMGKKGKVSWDTYDRIQQYLNQHKLI